MNDRIQQKDSVSVNLESSEADASNEELSEEEKRMLEIAKKQIQKDEKEKGE